MSQEDARSDIFAMIALGVVSLAIWTMMVIASGLGLECLNIALHASSAPVAGRVIIGACGIVSLGMSLYIALNTIAIAIALLLRHTSMSALFAFKTQLDKVKLGLRTAQQIVQIIVTEPKS